MSDKQEVRSSLNQALKPFTMLFTFFYALCDGTEGTPGVENISSHFEISCGRVSNYLSHVDDVLFKVLHDDPNAFIESPNAQERMDMQGLVLFSSARPCSWGEKA